MDNLTFYFVRILTHTKISYLPILIQFFLFRPRPPLTCQQARPYPRLSSTSNLHSLLHHGLQVYYICTVLKRIAIGGKVLPFTWKRKFDQPSNIIYFQEFYTRKILPSKTSTQFWTWCSIITGDTIIPTTCENAAFQLFCLETQISWSWLRSNWSITLLLTS